MTTQSVPDFVAASSRYSFINVLCISAALTASMPVAKAYVVAVVPLKTSVCGGLASVRSGSVTPGANQIGPAGATRNASSAIASAVMSLPFSTLISVMPPNRPPLPSTVFDCATESLMLAHPGGTPLTCVTCVAVVPVTLPISMIST